MQLKSAIIELLLEGIHTPLRMLDRRLQRLGSLAEGSPLSGCRVQTEGHLFVGGGDINELLTHLVDTWRLGVKLRQQPAEGLARLVSLRDGLGLLAAGIDISGVDGGLCQAAHITLVASEGRGEHAVGRNPSAHCR